jgi:hypothetical protein
MNMNADAYRLETTVPPNGTLTLERLPFPAGQAVQVIVLPLPAKSDSGNPYPLRGLPVRLEHPTEPVAEGDWGTLR